MPNVPAHEGRGGYWFQYHDHTGGRLLRLREREPSSLLHITSSGFKDWGAGVGVAFVSMTNAHRACAYDASVYRGIRFRARGTGRIRVVLAGLSNVPKADGGQCEREKAKCYDQPGDWIDLAEAWQTIELPFCRLFSEGWGGERTGVDPSELVSLHFRFQAGSEASLWLDDIAFFNQSSEGVTPKCGAKCPLDAAPRSARIAPHTTTATLTPELRLHTFEQASRACGNVTRRYLAYIPTSARASAPVLMVLHGSGSSAESMRSFMTRGRFEELAARDGHIVVYPNAAPGTPTDPNPDFPNTGSWRQEFFDDEQVDDVAYLTRVLDDLRARRSIDGNNAVYIAGISNGGGMALKLARQQPAIFRGVASIMGYDGEPPSRVPDLRDTGLARVLFLYSDRDPGLPKSFLKYQATDPLLWAKALGLSASVIARPEVTPLADRIREGVSYRGSSPVALSTRDSHAVQYDFQEPGNPKHLRLIVFDHAGHFWPHPDGEQAELAIDRWGFRNQDIDAADVIWQFFFGKPLGF